MGIGDRETGEEELEAREFLTLNWIPGPGIELGSPLSGSWLLKSSFGGWGAGGGRRFEETNLQNQGGNRNGFVFLSLEKQKIPSD